jgi:iron(III) transport system ATP-binding protein
MAGTTEAASGLPYLRIRGLVKRFGQFTALKGIDLDVREGEFVCFLGPSGCGKTTLLRCIAGLDIQTAGTVEQAGRDISVLPPSERDFGIVFQSYALFPNLTVEKNVAYGLENAGAGRQEIAGRVSELLDLVGLGDQGRKYPAQLSGGQQQRVALARALATSPGLLLLDEPLSALDAKVRVHLRHEIRSLQERLGVTTIMVTHDQEEALTMGDRIVVMNHGVIEQVGTPSEVYREPESLFVADFIGEMNRLDGVLKKPGEVAVGDLSFACSTDSIAEGAACLVTIRPEDIVIGPAEGKRAAGANTVPAVIRELEFLGSFWWAHLEVGERTGLHLRANVSINATRRMRIVEGMKVRAELPADRLRVFAAGQGR